MRQQRGRVVDVRSLAEFDTRIAARPRTLSGWQLQGIDLSGRGASLRSVEVAGALFLGCRLDPADEASLRARGAVVFPEPPGAPIDAYRTRLYSPAELYDAVLRGGAYPETLDARAYAWSRQAGNGDLSLATSLHDHAIDLALATWAESRRIVGVMGGHGLRRGEPAFETAALLGRLLARGDTGLTVATGGGPGAMEAANLGAYLAQAQTADFDEALTRLADVPSFSPDIGAWAQVALGVIESHPEGKESLGIPTWHYGHEPPNPFATDIAKYFRNSTREATLLQVCDAGIVFLPGAAGTVQEVFQDACENYYADDSSTAAMVLVDKEHWTRTLPVWQLLTALATDRGMARRIHLVDTVQEAVDLVRSGVA